MYSGPLMYLCLLCDFPPWKVMRVSGTSVPCLSQLLSEGEDGKLLCSAMDIGPLASLEDAATVQTSGAAKITKK